MECSSAVFAELSQGSRESDFNFLLAEGLGDLGSSIMHELVLVLCLMLSDCFNYRLADRPLLAWGNTVQFPYFMKLY